MHGPIWSGYAGTCLRNGAFAEYGMDECRMWVKKTPFGSNVPVPTFMRMKGRFTLGVGPKDLGLKAHAPGHANVLRTPCGVLRTPCGARV